MTSEEAWAAVSEHRSYIEGAIRRGTKIAHNTSSAIDIDDLVIAGLVRAHSAAQRYDTSKGGDIKQWLAWAAVRGARDELRAMWHPMSKGRGETIPPVVTSVEALIEAIGDTFEGPDELEAIETRAELEARLEALETKLQSLRARDAWILTERLRGRRLSDIAQRLGVTDARISQITDEVRDAIAAMG